MPRLLIMHARVVEVLVASFSRLVNDRINLTKIVLTQPHNEDADENIARPGRRHPPDGRGPLS